MTYHNITSNDLSLLKKYKIDGFVIPNKLKDYETILVRILDDILVSLIYISFNVSNEIIINYIYTNSSYRKRGYATQIVKYVLDNYKYKKVTVVILPDSNSDKIFAKFGFIYIQNDIMELSKIGV